MRGLAWSGVPIEVRSLVWKILLGYVPTVKKRRDATLQNRRNEYMSYLDAYYEACRDDNKSEEDAAILRQIRADIPRTSPGISFFKHPIIAASLERCLYVFAIRHPASGYVQGMNDLITPFYAVFVRDYISEMDIAHNNEGHEHQLDELSESDINYYEADCYWCMTALIDGIQDHYTFAQPGIQRQIYRMRELTDRVDAALVKHLDTNNIQFLHFCFRWMNCLLMRELSLTLIIRLWDSYLSDDSGTGFKSFHTYVCVAFLVKHSVQIKTLEHGDLILFLQKLPTENWTDKDIDTLIAQAFLYKSWFNDAPRHLQ